MEAQQNAIIIAHRGASAYRPEHTLASYQLAIEMGADFIEPDLVATKDGHLIARHENELSSTTNVADLKKFASYKTTKYVDGVKTTGWFSEDFTLSEIKQLKARERIPHIRPDNTQYNDQFSIPTFSEIIQLVKAEEERSGRQIGIYPETKHPTYFLHDGVHLDGSNIAISLNEKLIDQLVTENFTHSHRIYIQSFEIENLIELKHSLMPTAGLNIPLVQLIGNTQNGHNDDSSNFYQPHDLLYHCQQEHCLKDIYPGLTELIDINAHTNYQQLTQQPVLHWMKQHYAAAIGPWKNNLYRAEDSCLVVEEWFKQALKEELGIHPYTFRAENDFIKDNPASIDYQTELSFLLTQGITGFFTDHTDLGVQTRKALEKAV